MIEKTIHYCWFGGNQLPESVVKCIDSWKKYCPEYKIIQWNESNYDYKKNPYMSAAYEDHKFAFVTDYARLDIIYHHGGVYLDTDVELINSLDSLLELDMYLGFELPGYVNTGIGFGAKKYHPFLLENIKQYENLDYFNDKETCVYYTGKALYDFFKIDILNKNERLDLNGVTIFPSEFFCPLNMETNKLDITVNTKSIHHYDATWYGKNELKRRLKKKILPFKIKLKKYMNKYIGEGSYEKVKKKFRRM